MTVTNKKIVKTLEEGFRKMGEGFKAVDKRFKKIDRKFETIEMALGNYDHTLKTLVTRDEFNEFKKENLQAHEDMATSLEKLDQEFKSSTRSHDRLVERVDIHHEALKTHGLLPPPAPVLA